MNSNVQPFCFRFFQVETLGDIKLRLLHDLHLSNHAVLEREDSLAMFFDLLSDHFGDQLFHLRKRLRGHGCKRFP